jgi:hypothetical protein
MNFKILIFCLITTLCVSCSKKSDTSIKVGKGNASLEYEKISSLNEDLFLFGNIESFNFIDDEHFVVTTSKPSDVIIFNKNGQQVKKIGNIGRGPFEYQKPKITRVYNNKIFVWDDDFLKLIVYDKDGNSIKEYGGFKVAIEDFIVTKNYVCFYFGGGFSGMVGIYDLIKEQYVYRGGEPSEEHLLLSLNRGPGGMSIFREGLIYISADELSFKFLDFSNFKEKTILTLDDNEFKVENVNNATKIINSNRSEAVKYIMKNSYTTGLFKMGNKLVIKSEVGEFKQDKNNMNDNSDRFIKYYILNDKLELIQTVKSAHDFGQNNKLFTSYKGEIYCIKYNTSDENFHYELNKLKFEQKK